MKSTTVLVRRLLAKASAARRRTISAIKHTCQTDESAEEEASDLKEYSGSSPMDDQQLQCVLGCRFCAEILSLPYRVIPAEWELYDLFHSDCRMCVDEDSTLCDHCRHFRLRHLLQCTAGRHFQDWFPVHYTKESIQSQDSPSCAICSFIREIVLDVTSDVSDFEHIYIAGPDELSTKASGVWSRHYARTSWCTMNWRPSPDKTYSTVTFGIGLKSAPSSTTGPASTITYQSQSMVKDAGSDSDSESDARNGIRGWSITRAKILGDTGNWEVMKDLFAVCRKEHQDCHSSGFDPPIDFRLIDTKERSLIRSKGPVEFCSLSYVWGRGENSESKETEMLTKESLERLERPGSFTESPLPKTIEDAIQACSALGFRYLWVDRLCIVQDDERSKNHQIHAMGDIFASAELVLIALSSENMHTGIPGVSNSRQTEQWKLSSSELDLVRLPSLGEMIEGCQWRTRAWTYQEAVLPRRKLWLTGTQAYFQCCEGIFSEDTVHVSDNDGTYTVDRNRPKLPAQQYFAHLEAYSDRSLTFQSDIYNAFIGIANTVYGADILVYGLPCNDFDQALLWEVGFYGTDGRDAVGLTLPSWSWASIDGSVTSADVGYRSFCGTLVRWTVCVESDGQLPLERIHADNAPVSWIEQHNLSVYRNWESTRGVNRGHGLSPSLYMALAWSQDCIGAPNPSELQSFNNHTFDKIRAMAHDLWPTYNSFYQDLDSDQSQLDPTTFPFTCIPGSLHGYVQTAMLEILIHSDYQCELVHKGCQIGVMYLSTSSWRCGSTVKAIALSVFNGASPEWNNEHYLQEISSCYPSICRKDASREETKRVVAAGEEILRDPNENLTFFDCNGEALLPPPMLRLMIIEEDGPSYRRIGLGWAYLARWVQTDRKFETVTLR